MNGWKNLGTIGGIKGRMIEVYCWLTSHDIHTMPAANIDGFQGVYCPRCGRCWDVWEATK